MSTASAEPAVVERERSVQPRGPILWHNAASFRDLLLALEGQVYTTMCGKRCTGTRGVARLRGELPAIEQCVVCAEICGVINLGSSTA